jgi:hypothetical protein
MRYFVKYILAFLTLDWKSYALALALVSEPLAVRYGSMVGLAAMTIGWWLVLGGLLLAKRNDLPLWKIFNRQ